MKSYVKGDIIGYYYGSLVYGDLGAKRRLHKKYGTGILSVSTPEFDRWAMKISYQFADADSNMYEGFVVAAPFCVCRYLNDPRYLPGEDVPKAKKRVDNAVFKAKRTARWNRDFEMYDALQVVAKTDIRIGEELCVNYGAEYNFPSSEK